MDPVLSIGFIVFVTGLQYVLSEVEDRKYHNSKDPIVMQLHEAFFSSLRSNPIDQVEFTARFRHLFCKLFKDETFSEVTGQCEKITSTTDADRYVDTPQELYSATLRNTPNEIQDDLKKIIRHFLKDTKDVTEKDPDRKLMRFMIYHLNNVHINQIFIGLRGLMCSLFDMAFNDTTQQCEVVDTGRLKDMSVNPYAVGVLLDVLRKTARYTPAGSNAYTLNVMYDIKQGTASIGGMDYNDWDTVFAL